MLHFASEANTLANWELTIHFHILLYPVKSYFFLISVLDCGVQRSNRSDQVSVEGAKLWGWFVQVGQWFSSSLLAGEIRYQGVELEPHIHGAEMERRRKALLRASQRLLNKMASQKYTKSLFVSLRIQILTQPVASTTQVFSLATDSNKVNKYLETICLAETYFISRSHNFNSAYERHITNRE